MHQTYLSIINEKDSYLQELGAELEALQAKVGKEEMSVRE